MQKIRMVNIIVEKRLEKIEKLNRVNFKKMI